MCVSCISHTGRQEKVAGRAEKKRTGSFTSESDTRLVRLCVCVCACVLYGCVRAGGHCIRVGSQVGE